MLTTDMPAEGQALVAPSLPAPPGLHLASAVTAHVVALAVWAPSVHNTQPWWFAADDAGLRLYADAGRQLTVADPDGREMLMSCGAALFTARLALRAVGYIPETSLLPDPADPLLVARLTWQHRAAPAKSEMQLFSQVTSRRTHRGGFDPLPLSPDLVAALQAGASRDAVTLRVVTGEPDRAALAATVQRAQDMLRASSAHVSELASWVSPPGSPRRDGVPTTAYPRQPDHMDPDFPGREFSHGHRWGLAGAGAPTTHRSAGVVCLLTTRTDRPADWVRAGHALQRILLTSASCGVAAALHSQPVEIGSLRDLLRTNFCGGDYPQLLLRLGTVIQTGASVRRPAADVLHGNSAVGAAQR